MFPLADFTVALVGENIEKCDMQFATETFPPQCLWKKEYRMYKILKIGRPLVKPEASEGRYPKYHHQDLSGIIIEGGPFNHHELIWL